MTRRNESTSHELGPVAMPRGLVSTKPSLPPASKVLRIDTGRFEMGGGGQNQKEKLLDFVH